MVSDVRIIPDEIKRSLLEHHEKAAFILSTATTLENGQRKLAYATLELIRSDLESVKPDKEMDYGPILFKRAHLGWEAGERLLDELYGGQQLALQWLTQFSPFGAALNPRVQHFSSKAMHRNNRVWPVDLSEFACNVNTKAGMVNSMLNKPGLPLYPSGQEAILEFFELGRGSRVGFNDYGKLVVVVPDYRARISEFKIGYERVIITAGVGSAEPDSLRCKVYAAAESLSATSEDLKLVDKSAKFSIGFDPGRVIALLSDADGSQIDSRDWYPGYPYPDYAKVERPEQQIRDLKAGGEGKRIEFKGNIDDRDDFIETVIAFSNSEGGLILVGINDNGVPRGFKGDQDAIRKTIRDSCEPLVEPTFKEYELDGYPILSIEIPTGQDRPYLMKNKGIIYIRIGPNDVPITRLDLDQLMQARGGGLNAPWNSRVV